MKGKYGGPVSVDDFFQAIWQDREFFRRHNITHVRGAFLYFTPCDDTGRVVIIGDQAGNPIDGYISAGTYHSAADSYEPGTLEPRSLARAPASRFTP